MFALSVVYSYNINDDKTPQAPIQVIGSPPVWLYTPLNTTSTAVLSFFPIHHCCNPSECHHSDRLVPILMIFLASQDLSFEIELMLPGVFPVKMHPRGEWLKSMTTGHKPGRLRWNIPRLDTRTGPGRLRAVMATIEQAPPTTGIWVRVST